MAMAYGLTVFDSTGNIVFRVDNYPSDSRGEVVLMDSAGTAILTIVEFDNYGFKYMSI